LIRPLIRAAFVLSGDEFTKSIPDAIFAKPSSPKEVKEIKL